MKYIRQRIRGSITDQYQWHREPISLDKFIERLREMEKNNPEIEFTGDIDSEYGLSITGMRLENDFEFNERTHQEKNKRKIKAKKLWIERKKKNPEFKKYLQLKKKFEGGK